MTDNEFLDEFYSKVFPWNAEDSGRIYRALERAVIERDELKAALDKIRVAYDGWDAQEDTATEVIDAVERALGVL